jgi:hypothetical protein
MVLQGAESMLTFAWDTRLPENLDDDAWTTSPLSASKPSDKPRPPGEFSEMTPNLIKREVLAVLCPLRQNLRTRSYHDQISHIEERIAKAETLFRLVKDDRAHLAEFVHRVMEIDFGTLRLKSLKLLIKRKSTCYHYKVLNL